MYVLHVEVVNFGRNNMKKEVSCIMKRESQNTKRCMIQNTDNQGSTTIEVSLIMPLILLVVVLIITLLLSDLQQAGIHSELVVYSVEQIISRRESVDKKNIGNHELMHVTQSIPGYTKNRQEDVFIYTGKAELELAADYAITETVEQRIREVEVEKYMRRWQMLGEAVSE